jgi:hypothetical protein
MSDERDAADPTGLRSESGNVVAGDVLQGEFAGAGHQLAQALRDALIVGVDADGANRQLREPVAEALPQLRRGHKDFVYRQPETLDVDGQVAVLD